VKACDLGRIDWRKGEMHTPDGRPSGGPGMAWQPSKASRDVHAGEMLKIRNDGGEFVIEVLALSGVRGSATVAQQLYRETEESKAARAAVVEAKKAIPIYESAWEGGRPTKRDRRELNKFRGR